MQNMSRTTILVFLGLVTFSVIAMAHHSFAANYDEGKLPTGFATAYSKAIDQHTERSWFVFDKSGKLKTATPLSRSGDQISLGDFLKNTPGKPIACENPKAITPPPPCAICKNGLVICTSGPVIK